LSLTFFLRNFFQIFSSALFFHGCSSLFALRFLELTWLPDCIFFRIALLFSPF
jgi:hypothetical protein